MNWQGTVWVGNSNYQATLIKLFYSRKFCLILCMN